MTIALVFSKVERIIISICHPARHLKQEGQDGPKSITSDRIVAFATTNKGVILIKSGNELQIISFIVESCHSRNISAKSS